MLPVNEAFFVAALHLTCEEGEEGEEGGGRRGERREERRKENTT